ncbi:helix-turn-helix domain-containing protein [Thermomonospora umbrina]|uniref:PucR-like helix-turn-helix protein n=1 Tax=Thermomonospora umbrina TaxID=111806 RepID=A0A3D9T4H0_9ACTN|nr:helix-turn-helix domain-containing protein [Thermomonospora umbrina]REE98711.1 PucR-like helix-turn-helix protein [Thermomonospora umbrina]
MDNTFTTTGDEPLAQVPAELASPLRPHVQAAAEEMVREIQVLVPEYSRPLESRYGRRMRWAIQETVRHFVDAMGRPDPDWADLIEIYTRIGAYEARNGRSLDGLQTAIRVSGQVACRRFIKDARRLDWSLPTLGQVTESLFVFLEKIAGAAAQGYADAQEQVVTERERSRWRLRDLLIVDPPASLEAIADLSRSARWESPRTLALVAVRPPVGHPPPVMPPSILADWHGPDPYLVVPDPDGPGQDRLIASLVRECAAAVGPTVPVNKGALSLRWARHALTLVERGVIPEKGPIRCLDHIPTLVAAMSEELIGVALHERLTPLMALPPHRRDPLARTLLTYMENRDNAVAAAERLLVHEQTVRYRIRRLEEMFGDALSDPERRIEMLILLHTWVRFGDARDGDPDE